MSHLFKIIKDDDYSSIEAPAIVVKNVTAGPFEIDEDGRVLPSMKVAAIDPSCSICSAGIKNQKLVVLHTASPAKQSKNKTKNVPLPDEEATSTVAATEDNGSVQ